MIVLQNLHCCYNLLTQRDLLVLPTMWSLVLKYVHKK